jgi:tRNA/rRNA methyltransferase
MPFWTYLLRCSDDSFYVGHTDDLERRLAEHGSGTLPGYTQTRLPVTLAWSETFQTRDEALAFEQQLKGWSRTKKQALIAGDWDGVRTAARKPLRYGSSTGSAPTQDERAEGTDAGDLPNSADPHVEPRDEGEGAGTAEHSPPPVIILVRPQLGENIGKAARAMLNFGLTELRLVAPRDGWPNPAATAAASGADRVLAAAKLYDTLAEATADCAHVYATTVRKRGVAKPVVTPERAAADIHAAPGRAAILFGPERSGLETDDVAVARTIITVPINPEFGSLNLAQAVILVAYEWSKGVALAQPTLVEPYPPALQDDLDGMIGHLDRILVSTGHYFPPERAAVDRRQLRGILTRPGWTAGEVRTLRGVLRSIERKLGN